LRDLFFSDEFSFGASKLPVIRQSVAVKFRSYGENARWEFGNILFATINLPADNNHYLPDAGRNSEFEDRAIANRDWLQRVFTFAARKKWKGLYCFAMATRFPSPARHSYQVWADGATALWRYASNYWNSPPNSMANY